MLRAPRPRPAAESKAAFLPLYVRPTKARQLKCGGKICLRETSVNSGPARPRPPASKGRSPLDLPSAAASVLVSAPMDLVEKARIMDGMRINRALARLACEIAEENHGAGHPYPLGIQ